MKLVVWSHFIQLVQGVPSLTTLHFLLRLASRFQVLGVSGWDGGGRTLTCWHFLLRLAFCLSLGFKCQWVKLGSEARLVLSHIHTY